MPLAWEARTMFLGILCLIAVLACLYIAQDIVVPVVLALVLKLLFQPLVSLLERAHVPRVAGALIALAVLLSVFVGLGTMEGEIVTPMLLANRFTINPVAVILSLIFWYWMWGVPGAILAVPMSIFPSEPLMEAPSASFFSLCPLQHLLQLLDHICQYRNR